MTFAEPKLSPFFSYYGGKWRSACHYPPPKYDTIIEPFAGAAGYSTRYHDRKVILVEKNPKIAGLWAYLIKANAEEIRGIPLIEPGQAVADLNLACQEQGWLIGMAMNPGGAAPRLTRGKAWTGANYDAGNKMNMWSVAFRERVAQQVQHIRHWKVYEDSYQNLEQQDRVHPATWFIDPPYQGSLGKGYSCGSKGIDYGHLSHFCQTRSGQVVVCEAPGADWLPFLPLGASIKCTPTKNHGGRKHSVEMIWTNDNE